MPEWESAPLIEPRAIRDTFVNGIGRIEKLPGGLVRVVLFACETEPDGSRFRVVKCKLVRPICTWSIVVQQIATALAGPDENLNPMH